MTSVNASVIDEAREKQDAVREAARDLFKREWSPGRFRELISVSSGYSTDLWQIIRGLGWPGIVIPEEFGGGGGSLVELYGLAEELGRAIAPTPLLPTIAASHALLLSQNRPLQESLLPRLARGEKTLALALLEPGLTANPAAVSLAARESDGGFRLNGVKLFVPFGQHADALVTVALLPEDEGIALFLVDAGSGGLSSRSITPLDWSPLAEVTYDNIFVPAERLIARGPEASALLDAVLDRDRLIAAIELLGVAERAHELAVEYAGDRVAFGRPIGAFQAVKHRLVDLRAIIEVARALSQGAAQRLALDTADAHVATGRAVFWALDTLHKVPEGALQVFGGVGFTWEHDIHLYLRRAATLTALLGERATQREIVVSHLVGADA